MQEEAKDIEQFLERGQWNTERNTRSQINKTVNPLHGYFVTVEHVVSMIGEFVL